MILDNVNPNDLFPTESKGPSVLGVIEYNVQGQSEFEGAFVLLRKINYECRYEWSILL